MSNAIYGKTIGNLRNRINVKLVNIEKDYLKSTSKPNYRSHKIFDNNLVAIRKSKVTLKLNKPGMCVLELSEVIMYRFPYNYIKNKYDNKSKLLFIDTDSLMYEIKTEDVYKDFSSDKKMFDFSNYLIKWKYYEDSNKLVIGKMKDKIGGVAIKIFVKLNTKMYSLLVDNSEQKKAKYVNRNAVTTRSHNEYKDFLLNNKCIRHSLNRIMKLFGFMKSRKFYCLVLTTKYIFKTIISSWLPNLIIKRNSLIT